MRIVYLHQYFNTPDMPGGTRSYEMARRLVRAGHTVDMVTSDRDPQARGGWRMTEESGMRVHWIPVPYSNSMDYPRRILAFLSFSFRAALKAAELGGDLVFATSTPLTIVLPAIYAAKKNGIPMVLEIRDVWPAVPIAVGALKDPFSIAAARWLERFAYKNASRIVALAPGMKDEVAQSGYPTDQISVIPNGADLDIFDMPLDAGRALRNRHDWLGERPLVAFVGAIGKVNGVDYLARLAAAVRTLDPEIRFAVIGTGREAELVRETARSLGVLDETFFMLGELPKRDAAVWLSACDVATALFTGPRIVWKDAVQNKFFDALAAGKPVINNFDGWQSQVAVEAGAGIILNPKDTDTAARDLVAILRDRIWLAKAGAAAKTLAIERFSRDRLAAQLETVLSEMLTEVHHENPRRSVCLTTKPS